jgi:hypothetical protein
MPIAADKGHIHNWLGASKGSRLFISLKGTTQDALVIGTVEFIAGFGPSPPVIFPDSAVQPGPLILPLPDTTAYDANLIITFATKATASVSAFVEQPNGEHFSVDCTETFEGEQGESTLVAYTITTINPDFLR